jgi:hypothetical protein
MAISNRVRLVPAGRNGRPLSVATLIVLAITLSIVKPWGSSPGTARPSIAGPVGGRAAGPSSGAIRAAGRSLGVSAIRSPSPASNISGPCYYGLAWRLFTAETSSVGPVHTWYGVQPLQASGPTDPRIRAVQVHSTAIGQVGYCLVTQPKGPIHVLDTEAWQLVPGSAPRQILLAPAAGTAPANPDDGVVYLPPPSKDGSAGLVWAPSVYVFVVRLATAPVTEEWFAIDIS